MHIHRKCAFDLRSSVDFREIQLEFHSFDMVRDSGGRNGNMPFMRETVEEKIYAIKIFCRKSNMTLNQVILLFVFSYDKIKRKRVMLCQISLSL